jgi:hypothetical protein
MMSSNIGALQKEYAAKEPKHNCRHALFSADKDGICMKSALVSGDCPYAGAAVEFVKRSDANRQ